MHTPLWAYFMFWGMVIFAAIGLACSSVMLLEWLDKCRIRRKDKCNVNFMKEVQDEVRNDVFCARVLSKIAELNNLIVGLGLGIKLIQEQLAKLQEQTKPRSKK